MATRFKLMQPLVIVTLCVATLGRTASEAMANITFVGGVVQVTGSAAKDQLTVSYVSAPGGVPSATPTAWIEVELVNAGVQVATFPTLKVDLISFNALGSDDRFYNDTYQSSYVRGGPGNDYMVGGYGSDEFHGEDGHDHLIGREGNDVLDGESGDDRLEGGPGADFLVGDSGNDQLDGGLDDDSLFGGSGNDDLLGGPGDDVLDGGIDDDSADGEGGRDLVIGNTGRDALAGGDDNDVVIGGALDFDPMHAALSSLWAEWTSTHSFADRIRNLLGIWHAGFHLRWNDDYFLTCAKTVIDDGAKDTIVTVGGSADLIIDGPFDDVFHDVRIDVRVTCN